MEKVQALPSYCGYTDSLLSGISEIFNISRKTAIIQLRWPVVIICAYLVLYSKTAYPISFGVQSLLLVYVLSNALLYIADKDLFESSPFHSGLVIFDTLFLTASLILLGQTAGDLTITYFLIIILCGICNDFRGLILIAFLAPVIYGHLILQTSMVHTPVTYLRLLFPFVISLFYGYMLQLVHLENNKRERVNQDAQRIPRMYALSQFLLEKVGKKFDAFEALVKINLDIAGLLDRETLLRRVAEEARKILRMDAANFRLIEGEKLVLCSFVDTPGIHFQRVLAIGESLAGKVVQQNCVLAIRDIADDPTIMDEHRRMLQAAGYHAYLGIPLRIGSRVIGSLTLVSREEREFSREEINLMSAFAAQAAIAIQNANLFAEVKQQSLEVEKMNRELHKAHRTKNEFMKGITHEFRTPLSVIIGNTSLCLDGSLGGISHQQRDALEKVMRNSEILHKLIDNVLTFSRVEAETMTVEPAVCKVEDILANIRTYIDRHLNRDKRIEVFWDVEENLPPLTTEGPKLEEILLNLIGNAFKFTAQGRIGIRVRNLQDQRRIQFSILDTGIGIPESDLKVIFDEFYQLKEAHTGHYNGVGLGLSIVKHYLKLMGGEIHVESQPGAGSTFTFTLPYSPAEGLSRLNLMPAIS